MRLLRFDLLPVATERLALPIFTAVDDEIGLRELDARVPRPTPQGHVGNSAILPLDRGRGDEILVVRQSRKVIEIVGNHGAHPYRDWAHVLDQDSSAVVREFWKYLTIRKDAFISAPPSLRNRAD